MRSVHSAGIMCQFWVTKISAGDSLYVSLKVVWGSLCPLLQAKNMNPILLAATWLTACEGSLQRLAQPSRVLSLSCSKLQDTNPICCPAGTYVALTQEMCLSAFSPLSLLLSQLSGVMTASQITMTIIVSLWLKYHGQRRISLLVTRLLQF